MAELTQEEKDRKAAEEILLKPEDGTVKQLDNTDVHLEDSDQKKKEEGEYAKLNKRYEDSSKEGKRLYAENQELKSQINEINRKVEELSKAKESKETNPLDKYPVATLIQLKNNPEYSEHVAVIEAEILRRTKEEAKKEAKAEYQAENEVREKKTIKESHREEYLKYAEDYPDLMDPASELARTLTSNYMDLRADQNPLALKKALKLTLSELGMNEIKSSHEDKKVQNSKEMIDKIARSEKQKRDRLTGGERNDEGDSYDLDSLTRKLAGKGMQKDYERLKRENPELIKKILASPILS